MRQRIITGSLFGLGLLAIIGLGWLWSGVFYLFYLALAVGIFLELRQAFAHKNFCLKQQTVCYTLVGILLIAITGNSGAIGASIDIATQLGLIALFSLGVVVLLFMKPMLQAGEVAGKFAVIQTLSWLYLSFPLFAGGLILALNQGKAWFILALITPSCCDVAAYFSGMFLGQKLWVPKVSPKKTWAGFFGGLIGTIVLYYIFFLLWFTEYGTWYLSPISRCVVPLYVGACASLAAQFGDLLASAIKRYTGIKDFANIFPGHGGLLDRFDSYLLVLPVLFCWALLLK